MFGGASDGLLLAPHGDLLLDSDFTIEAWINSKDISDPEQTILKTYWAGSGEQGLMLFFNHSATPGKLSFFV